MIRPIPATVAGLEPEIAAKNTQLSTVVMPSPPVTCPTKALARLISLRTSPPVSMTALAKKKNGTAMSEKWSRLANAFWPMIGSGIGSSSSEVTTTDPPRATATGAPMAIRRKKAATSRIIVTTRLPTGRAALRCR